MALELQQDVIRSRKTPAKADPALVVPAARDGLVQVKVRDRGEGKISTGLTREPNDPLSKTEPFGWHKAGDVLWVTPQAAEIYDERRWVNLVDGE